MNSSTDAPGLPGADLSAINLDIADLPIREHAEEIEALIARHQVLVLAGETGSGKTTQLPKLCLRAGRGRLGAIAHTQPRRVAARTVAQRICSEMKLELGGLVGYQVRFNERVSDNTIIKLMTDGILLAEIQRDPLLRAYDTVIVDEAHERSLNIDFILGYLQQLLPRRPDLRVIVTSATIDEERFAAYFGGAPIVRVGGRTFPVALEYRPPDATSGDLVQQVVDAVGWCLEQSPPAADARDMLVFLSGEREIRESAQQLRELFAEKLQILPLYARLGAADQDRVFRGGGGAGRRVVLATNVAETSITVPGIGFVIDTGVARISRFSARSRIQRLPIEAISKASAEQRAGRAGRVAPGVCVRLYAEADYLGRAPFTDPEIRRTNLSTVILRMAALGLGSIRDFPFPEPPDGRQIAAGIRDLQDLQLLDGQSALTPLGKKLALLPVDPALARMLSEAGREGCLREMSLIVAAMSLQDPRERPQDKREQAAQKHKPYTHPESDFVSWILLWDAFETERQRLTRRQLQRWCEKSFLSWSRMLEWRDIHRQLRIVCRQQGWHENQKPAEYPLIHRCLIAGLPMQLGLRQEDGSYLGPGNRRFTIFPGSALYRVKAKWILVGEMMETSQVFAMQAARIEPEWAEEVSKHLLQSEYLQPSYNERRGEVTARVRKMLGGLLLSEDQRVSYKSIDALTCHQVFVREALAEGKYRYPAPFLRHNREFLERLEELQQRSRRFDMGSGEDSLYQFYLQQVPTTVLDRASFENWRKTAERENPRILFLDDAWLVRAELDMRQGYPDKLEWQGVSYPLTYEFDPSGQGDGVTLQLTLDQLQGFPRHLADWLVPGMLEEKLLQLLRTLPKQYRRTLQPMADKAARFALEQKASDDSLCACLADWLHRQFGCQVGEHEFRPAALEPFFLMNFRLVDGDGKQVAVSRNLDGLRREHQQMARQALEQIEVHSEANREVTGWDFGPLPAQLDISHRGRQVRVWPGLEDRRDRVLLRHFDHPRAARQSSRTGLARLYLLQLGQARRFLEKDLFKRAELLLVGLPWPSRTELVDELLMATASDLFDTEITRIADAPSFQAQLEAKGAQLVPNALAMETILLQVAKRYQAISRRLEALPAAMAVPQAAMRRQLGDLIGAGSFAATPPEWRPHLIRFMQAMEIRLDKLAAGSLSRDLEAQAQVDLEWLRYKKLCEFADRDVETDWPELISYRWMIEELIVSLFSQPLKTSRPVSQKRLQQLVEKLEIAQKRAMVRHPK